MKYLPISKLLVTKEAEATGEVAEIFNEIRSMHGTPTVADAMKLGDPEKQQILER
jgi:hypothetical protein